MKRKPSISKLLALLDKPALLYWANKIGLQGISLDDHRAKSKSDGNKLHNEIMHYCKEKTPFSDLEIQKRFENFLSKNGIEIISVEQSVENDYFQGRYDVKIKYRGKIYICDYKSSDKVYFENELQLMGYRMCEENCELAVIHIPDFKISLIDTSKSEEYETILMALSLIYECKYKIEF